MTKKRGRPFIEFKWEVLDAILQYGAGKLDCSEILGCSEDTIDKNIKRKYNLTFSEYRNKKMGRVRVKLLQKQIEVAMSGNPSMLIWVGKQILGQSDKNETISDGTSPIKVIIERHQD